MPYAPHSIVGVKVRVMPYAPHSIGNPRDLLGGVEDQRYEQYGNNQHCAALVRTKLNPNTRPASVALSCFQENSVFVMYPTKQHVIKYTIIKKQIKF